MTAGPLLEIDRLVKRFPLPTTPFRAHPTLLAVDHVSLFVPRGETLGLVGESGSGKTTLGRCALRLIEPDAGSVRFGGLDLLALTGDALRQVRRRAQIVFQDATLALNPRMRIGAAVREPVETHGLATGTAAQQRAVALLQEVGLDAALARSFPHQLSGGQRQRVGIARALSVDPEFLVLDEPVSSLDVSIGAQVLNLLADLQQRRGLTYLLIAHDLAVVRHLASRVAVMYLGRLVEIAPATPLYQRPLHPYTASLLAAAPVPDPAAGPPRAAISGEPPRSARPRTGCPFQPRCPYPKKSARCTDELPELREVNPGRWAACHHAEEQQSATLNS
jgi:oligopeptide/dipeptide ABC transporter ATP-binding protein